MNRLLCKIFNFVLNLFSKVVGVVAEALKTVGSAAVDVLSDLASSVAGSVLSNPLGIALLGLGAWFLFSQYKEKDERDIRRLELTTQIGNQP